MKFAKVNILIISFTIALPNPHPALRDLSATNIEANATDNAYIVGQARQGSQKLCDLNPQYFPNCQPLDSLGHSAGARLGSPASGLVVVVAAALGLGL